MSITDSNICNKTKNYDDPSRLVSSLAYQEGTLPEENKTPAHFSQGGGQRDQIVR